MGKSKYKISFSEFLPRFYSMFGDFKVPIVGNTDFQRMISFHPCFIEVKCRSSVTRLPDMRRKLSPTVMISFRFINYFRSLLVFLYRNPNRSNILLEEKIEPAELIFFSKQ